MEAYESKAGNCTGYSSLMVALCRASGIPSQQISGIVLPELLPSELLPFQQTQAKTWEHTGEAHGWVEFYTENGWETADPTFASRTLDYFQFGWSDGTHLSYGDAECECKIFDDVYKWATSQAYLIGQSFSAIKFVATADPPVVFITPTVTVKKGWDGRIFNTFVVWSITLIPILVVNRKWLK